jgi:uncharacterized protein (TIGR02001 family)
LLALAPPIAAAQLSGTVSAMSDYRYRGVSLSSNGPAAQAGIAYDFASGLYAGAVATSVRYSAPTAYNVQTVSYAGFAHRTATGASIDVGASYTHVGGSRGYDYPQVYLGVAGDVLSARVYYAPHYAGYDTRTLYAEANGAWPLGERARLLAHAGVLHGPVSTYYFYRPEYVYDGRIGIAVDVDRLTFQLAWAGVSSGASYPFPPSGAHRNGVLLEISAAF